MDLGDGLDNHRLPFELVPEPLVRPTVRTQEPASRLPSPAPSGLGEPCGEVVAIVGELLPGALLMEDTGLCSPDTFARLVAWE